MILHETGAGGCSIYFNLSMSVIATKSTGISSKTKRKVLNLHGVFAIFIILLNDLSGMSQ